MYNAWDIGRFAYDRTPLGAPAKILSLYNEHIKGRTLEDNEVSEWLYGEWTEEKYKQYLAYNSVYPIRLYFNYLLDYRGANEYLDRYGMDWSDIHDPRKLNLSQSGSALGGYALNFVSKNIGRLYR